jgi:hypothetical protein
MAGTRRHGEAHIIDGGAVLGACIRGESGIDCGDHIIKWLLLLSLDEAGLILWGKLLGVSWLVTIQTLLREDRVRQGRVLIHICLRVDSPAQIQVTTTTDTHTTATATTTTTGSIHTTAIGKDMRESAFGAKLAVALNQRERHKSATTVSPPIEWE